MRKAHLTKWLILFSTKKVGSLEIINSLVKSIFTMHNDSEEHF